MSYYLNLSKLSQMSLDQMAQSNLPGVTNWRNTSLLHTNEAADLMNSNCFPKGQNLRVTCSCYVETKQLLGPAALLLPCIN